MRTLESTYAYRLVTFESNSLTVNRFLADQVINQMPKLASARTSHQSYREGPEETTVSSVKDERRTCTVYKLSWR